MSKLVAISLVLISVLTANLYACMQEYDNPTTRKYSRLLEAKYIAKIVTRSDTIFIGQVVSSQKPKKSPFKYNFKILEVLKKTSKTKVKSNYIWSGTSGMGWDCRWVKYENDLIYLANNERYLIYADGKEILRFRKLNGTTLMPRITVKNEIRRIKTKTSTDYYTIITPGANLTILHKAAIVGDLDYAKKIPNIHQLINKRDEMNLTPIRHAQKYDNYELIHFLLKKGANKNAASLIFELLGIPSRLKKGYKGLLHYLVNELNDVNIKDKYGNTLLNKLIKTGDLDLVEQLIKKGANVNLLDKDKTSPLHAATSLSFWDSWNSYYRMHNPNFKLNSKQFYQKFRVRRLAISKLLLANHAKVNALDSKGNGALHFAVNREFGLNLVILLLKYKANVNIVNHNGKTPIQDDRCCNFKKSHIRKLKVRKTLLKHGASQRLLKPFVKWEDI